MSNPAQSTSFLTIGGFTPPKPTTGTVIQPAFGTMNGETTGTGSGLGKAPTGEPYNLEDEHRDIKPKTEEGPSNPGYTRPEETLRQMTQTTATPKPNEKDGKKETKIDVVRMPQGHQEKNGFASHASDATGRMGRLGPKSTIRTHKIGCDRWGHQDKCVLESLAQPFRRQCPDAGG